MTYHQILFYVDGGAVTLTLVLMGRFAWVARKSPNAWLVVVMGAVSIAYLLSTRQDYAPLLPAAYAMDFGAFHPVLNLLRNAGPGAFALLCHRIFRPGRPFPLWLFALVALQLGMEEVEWIVGPAWQAANPQVATLLYEVVPALLQIALLGVALVLMLTERDADLVERRRQTRRVLLIVYVVQVVFSLGLERIAIGLGVVPDAAMYPIHALSVMAGLAALICILWALVPEGVGEFVDPLKARSQRAPRETDNRNVDAARLRKALEIDRAYRQPGLTVAGLATLLSLPEYRLRRLIHDELGYRNFNTLLHEYRVAEVCDALQDPSRDATPVLTLALSAGYQSLTPFNRAFKDLNHMTPTEFRQRARRQGTADQPGNTSATTSSKVST